VKKGDAGEIRAQPHKRERERERGVEPPCDLVLMMEASRVDECIGREK
jgi:hypothetical protein